MKITPDFTRLHTGENASRGLEIEIDEAYRDKSVRLGFITPMGRAMVTDALSLSGGRAVYSLPSALLDGKGLLLCQILVYDGDTYMCKSPVLELPVYMSVDDASCPAVSGEGLRSLALMWEILEGKAEMSHSHNDTYYTKAQTDSIARTKSSTDHLHTGVYLTRQELEDILENELSGGYEHNHDELYYRKSALDEVDTRLEDAEGLLSSISASGMVYRRILTSADDLDNITENGIYAYETASVPANAPFPNAAVVEVFGTNKSSRQKIQRVYRYGAAGYTAYRPYIDSAWLSWTKDPTDYVVEQGTKGKWHYRKWFSGRAEAWGTGSIELSKDAYDWGSGIYCASGYGSLPSGVFTAVSGIQATPVQWYQISASARVTAGLNIEGNVFGKTSSFTSLAKGDAVEFNCIVYGSWK